MGYDECVRCGKLEGIAMGLPSPGFQKRLLQEDCHHWLKLGTDLMQGCAFDASAAEPDAKRQKIDVYAHHGGS